MARKTKKVSAGAAILKINQNARRDGAMKALKRDLRSVAKGLEALRRQTEKMVKQLQILTI